MRSWRAASGRRAADPPGASFSSGALCSRDRWSWFIIGADKTHMALGLGQGLTACQRGLPVRFTTAAALVHELIEARDERRLLDLQWRLSRLKLLIIDKLGFVPLSRTGAELLFEVFIQRYERGPILVTTNLPFDEWTGVFGSERVIGALLDCLTHHIHILEMNGESYRLKRSRESAGSQPSEEPDAAQLTLTLSSLVPKWAPLHLPCRPRSSGRWYTIPPPHWYGLPTPLTHERTEWVPQAGMAEAVHVLPGSVLARSEA